ncbi:hypothetical protein B0H14DRAFT_2657150 [Mycena olivaceomarginata]|nr:hypothetical protein B0H14DRAFT_2657150 [Mycena olivaceomarginata]
MGVGSALLQFLVVQHELGEPLNLNGDRIEDLKDESVVACLPDGEEALNAMFSAIPSTSLPTFLQRAEAEGGRPSGDQKPAKRAKPGSKKERKSGDSNTSKRKRDDEIDQGKPPKRAKISRKEGKSGVSLADVGLEVLWNLIELSLRFACCKSYWRTRAWGPWKWIRAGLQGKLGCRPELRSCSLETRLGSGTAWAEQVKPGQYGWLRDAHIRINQSYCKPRRVGVELCCSAFVVAVNHGDGVSRNVLMGVVEEGNANNVLKDSMRTCSRAEDKPKPTQAQAIKARTAKFKLRQAGQAVWPSPSEKSGSNVAATWAKPTPSQLGGADLSRVESSRTAELRST